MEVMSSCIPPSGGGLSRSVSASASASSEASRPKVEAWKSMLAGCSAKVIAAEARPLNVPLLAPFTIATTKLEAVHNVGIRVELQGGAVGWGEAPTLPPVTSEDQRLALDKASQCCDALLNDPSTDALSLLKRVGDLLPTHDFASARAGVEMALFDAISRSLGMPLWRLFGGARRRIITDITIPICEPAEAAALAHRYAEQGFQTIKCKIGGRSLSSDIAMLLAVRSNHPDCSLVLDANEGYTSEEALRVLKELYESGVSPILFEQPVAREDYEGLAIVNNKSMELYEVPVAADESCWNVQDAERIAREGLAGVINVKLAKMGVLGSLDVVSLALREGIDLMIGGMVETRLAMGFAGQLAAGLGCFRYVDLDTPLLLSDDPVRGGYQVQGPVYTFTDEPGLGASLDWS